MSETKEELHQISSKVLIGICTVLLSIILSITGYLSINTLQKLAQIQKDVITVRLKLSQVQNKMITEARIRDIIDYKILQFYNTKQIR